MRLCIVCARGGSKGVPGKNLRLLRGRPLIAHSVQQALDSGCFEGVAVSSDSPEIRRAALEAGARWEVVRPDELANDTCDKQPSLVHCAREVERVTGLEFAVFCDLDVTAPLRTGQHVREAVAQLEASSAPNLISVCPSRRNPYYNLLEIVDGRPQPCKPVDPPYVRRQDCPPTYDMNASIYLWRREAFFGTGAESLQAGTKLYVMPEFTLFDIDHEFDFELVEHLFGRLDELARTV